MSCAAIGAKFDKINTYRQQVSSKDLKDAGLALMFAISMILAFDHSAATAAMGGAGIAASVLGKAWLMKQAHKAWKKDRELIDSCPTSSLDPTHKGRRTDSLREYVRTYSREDWKNLAAFISFMTFFAMALYGIRQGDPVMGFTGGAGALVTAAWKLDQLDDEVDRVAGMNPSLDKLHGPTMVHNLPPPPPYPTAPAVPLR